MALMFDHEKLDVYQLELHFITWVTPVIEQLAKQADVRTRDICDHLERASVSALFNTAEGNGKRQRQTRAKFLDDARGSVTECAACLDALVARGASTTDAVGDGKTMLVRVYQMLTKLVQRYDSGHTVREEEAEYGVSAGDEHECSASSEEKIDDEDDDEDEDEPRHE